MTPSKADIATWLAAPWPAEAVAYEQAASKRVLRLLPLVWLGRWDQGCQGLGLPGL